MYLMKEACQITGMKYENLKFYCNQGLIPNVKRDNHNYRIFDDKDIEWIKTLTCLKNCGMGIAEMKLYLELIFMGDKTIPRRKEILAVKKDLLLLKMKEIQNSIDYIDNKQLFYDKILNENVHK